MIDRPDRLSYRKTMSKAKSKPPVELLPVKEWLHDFYVMTEGNTIRALLGNVWDLEAESEEAANQLVNTRIETLTLWLNGFKRKTR